MNTSGMASLWRLTWGCCAALVLASAARAAELRFDKTTYVVMPGETFQAHLYLDMDPSLAGEQVPVGGLFSAGTRVLFDSTKAAVTNVNNIILPAALDFGGFGGSAERELGPGNAAALGLVEGLDMYYAPLVLTLAITVGGPGTFQIVPDMFYSDTRANFLDGDLNVLDGQITNLTPSSVVVVDQPDITGVWRDGDELAITFANTNSPAPAYVIVSCSNPPPAGVWLPEPSVPILTNAPGVYTARVAISNLVHRFYRIVALW